LLFDLNMNIKWFPYTVTALLCFAASSPIQAEETQIMVMGDRVNLRNESSLDSDVIAQVNYGDELIALEIGAEWIRVRPPATVPVWVHAGLLFEEREVRARVLNVRSGPGTQFSSVGILSRGDPVQVLESIGEWRRIAIPESVHLYISRDFVQIPARTQAAEEPRLSEETAPVVSLEPVAHEDEARPAFAHDDVDAMPVTDDVGDPLIETQAGPTLTAEPEPPVVTAPVEEIPQLVQEEPEAPVVIAPVEEIPQLVQEEPETPGMLAPENVTLVPLPGQGTASVRRGWVKAYLLAGSSPSRFHLVHRQGSHEQTLCYLQGDEEQLRSLAGRQVQIRGRDFWVAGQRVPLTRIESVEPLEHRGE